MIMNFRPIAVLTFVLFASFFRLSAADEKPATSATLSAFDTGELALFERKAALAKRLGATHVPITDGLPVAKWQFQPADDPYPAWFIQRPDFFNCFPPPKWSRVVD